MNKPQQSQSSLSAENIRSLLSLAGRAALGEIRCFDLIDSTNRWLLDQARQGRVHNHICIAGRQTSGTGRNDKPWLGGSDNILLSAAHEFDLPPARLSGLSLAVGIAIVDALESLGVEGLLLKWPNDVYLDDGKLAGILIQSLGASQAGQCVVVGIGVNIRIDARSRQAIGRPVAELSRVGLDVDQRERIIARILDELFSMFRRFAENGFESFMTRWDELDYLKGREVVLKQGDQRVCGHYLGVNQQGALRLRLENNHVREYYVGELSVRTLD